MKHLALAVLTASLIAQATQVPLPVATPGPPAAPPPAATWSPPASSRPSTDQRFISPIPHPLVLRSFDHLVHNWDSGHRGVDLRGREGDEILAAGAGVVVYSGFLVDRNVISIEHSSGLRTTYLPVDPLVEVGQRVSAGQVIGTLESGHCLSACLHWGAKNGDRYYDPMSLLEPLEIRLYPSS